MLYVHFVCVCVCVYVCVYRVRKPASKSIAGMAAEDAQKAQAVTSRASAAFPCRAGLDM